MMMVGCGVEASEGLLVWTVQWKDGTWYLLLSINISHGIRNFF